MPLLARDRVRYIGQPVAMVIAETLNEAKDAAELIEVEYEDLPSVTTLEEAIAPDAPPVWDECRDNIAFFHEAGNKAAAEKAIAKADHVIKHRMRINRLTTVSMEPRGCLAEYDPRDDRYTLRCTVQGPHQVRRTLAQDVFKRSGDQGPRDLRQCRRRLRHEGRRLSGISARAAGGEAHRPAGEMDRRPQRSPSSSDEHCRDNITEAELALDKDGKFLAIRVQQLLQHRRLQRLRPQRRPADQQYRRARRHLHVPGRLRRGQRHLHQHHAHRPLSRRRPAGSRLCARDAGRPRRAQARHRSRGAAPHAT